MRKKGFKTKLLLGCLSLIGVLATAFSSVTLAKYIRSEKTTQSAYGLGGEKQVSIFFNANIWKQGKDSSGNIVEAVYYLYVWNTSSVEDTKETIVPSAHVTPTISGVKMDLYVFEFDASKLNRMIFLRWNPEIAPSTDLTHGDDKGNWNQTTDQTYSPSTNYYCIDEWGTGNPAVATPTTNRIVKNPSTGALTWAS